MFDEIYMDKHIIEDKLYRIIDQLNEKKTKPVHFYSIFLNEIRSVFDVNGRTLKILFANDNEIFKVIDETKNQSKSLLYQRW